MFDKLEDLARRLEEINMLLTEPDIINNQDKYKELMREQSELAPIVSKYKEYAEAKEGIEDSLTILDEESDEEMKELAKEELNSCKEKLAECEQELKILMLPKDPMMIKMLLWKYVVVQVGMKLPFLQQTYSVCILNLLKITAGK